MNISMKRMSKLTLDYLESSYVRSYFIEIPTNSCNLIPTTFRITEEEED